MPAYAAAQQPKDAPLLDVPTWVGEFTTLSANALLGGLTAGVVQKVRGGSFQDGFTRGALGGSVVYLGKRVSVERFDGAGFAGRELAAVGTSIVRNAAEGEGSLERLMLPIGPVRLYVSPGAATPVQAKVDVMTLFWTGYAVVAPELSFDVQSSLSAGTPVFRVADRLLVFRGDTAHAAGLALGGTLLLSDVQGIDTRETFAHERIHVIQNDQLFYSLVDPLEGWAVRKIPGGSRINQWVDFNTANLFLGLLTPLFDDHDRRPWELEANFLMRR